MKRAFLILLLFVSVQAVRATDTPTPGPTATATPELSEIVNSSPGQEAVFVWTFTFDEVAESVLLLAILFLLWGVFLIFVRRN